MANASGSVFAKDGVPTMRFNDSDVQYNDDFKCVGSRRTYGLFCWSSWFFGPIALQMNRRLC